MAYTEPTSAFIKPDNVIQTAQFTDFSTVPSNGYNLLIRAKRNGRWWLLKGLKEQALAYVQSRQTQHRDLKPSNIMLTNDGQHLKLIDFGLSDTDSHTILKAPAGTEGRN